MRDENLGLKLLASPFVHQRDLVFAAFAGLEAPLEHSPSAGHGGEFHPLDSPRRSPDARDDVSFFNGESARIKNRRHEKNGVAIRGFLRAERQANALAFGKMPLVRHPARHLAPESVVILILNSPPPAPCAIRAHKKDFTAAAGPGNENRHTSRFTAQGRVNREHLRAWTASLYGGRPVESRQIFPDRGICGRIRREHCQQMPRARGSESEVRLKGTSVAMRLRLIKLYRQKIANRASGESQLATANAREEHHAAALLLHYPFHENQILFFKFTLAQTDIAQEDDVEPGHLLPGRGKCRNIVASAAGLHSGVEKKALHLHSGIAGERVPKVAVFPARERIHHQDLQRLRRARKYGMSARCYPQELRPVRPAA